MKFPIEISWLAFYVELSRLPHCRTYRGGFGLSVVVQSAFRRLQLPQLRACVCAIGCTNDMPMRERREIRGSGPARARVSRGNIHTYCGQAEDFRVSSEFEAYRPMRYMSYSD